MSAAASIAPVAASGQLAEPLRQKKLSQSYPDVFNYLLKKFADDQAITKTDFAILRYTQFASIFPMQYADQMNAKSFKVANVYDESSFSRVFVRGVDSSFCHILCES